MKGKCPLHSVLSIIIIIKESLCVVLQHTSLLKKGLIVGWPISEELLSPKIMSACLPVTNNIGILGNYVKMTCFKYSNERDNTNFGLSNVLFCVQFS
jgi:hypothetical protein